MNKNTLKQLTLAHSWLGLIISGALMIIFVCGSLSFFKANIHSWEQYHHYNQALPTKMLSPGEISKILLDRGYEIPADHRVMILFPTEDNPQYQAYFSTESANGRHQRHRLFFDPQTGEELKNLNSRYYLSEFLYKLHIDLNIPAGEKIVGIVSLLFFVIIFSGILIHLKKMIKNFYQYRLGKNKDTYLDGHNLIGVTSLPFTFMYALTGVMFNLSIIYQASFGLFVFQGDRNALAEVSGFVAPTDFEITGKPMNIKNIDLAVTHANQQLSGAQVYLAKIWGFGDQNAQMQLRLVDSHSITERVTIDYPLSNYLDYTAVHVMENPVQGTYHVLKQLHYGNFGGITLQIIYFLLGLACCYLILSGNLIWLEKRAINRKQSSRNLNIVRAMTLCLSIGVLGSVAACFIATRFLPTEFARTDALPYLFATGLFVSFIHAYLLQSNRQVMVQQALFAAVLFATFPIYDTIKILMGHVTEGALLNLILVNFVALLVSGFCLLFAYHKRNTKQRATEVHHEFSVAQ